MYNNVAKNNTRTKFNPLESSVEFEGAENFENLFNFNKNIQNFIT